jgi:sensor histidine kinase regulating citrate/malate metabolism
MEKRMLLQQNRYYENQFELMKKVLLTTRSFRHDIVNHLTIIQMMVQKNEQSRLVEYLANLLKVSNQHEKFIRSGNIIIDCILNYKLQVIEQKDIQVLLDINIPEELTIDPLDMTVILGNLLDNAINASDKLGKENRKISIIIRLDKDVLRINIKNKYNGVVLYKGDKIITSQKDKLNHGIGLMNVKNVIDKYQGIFNIEITENDFSVIVLLMR